MPDLLQGGRRRRSRLDALGVLVWCVIVPAPWIALAVIVARTWGL